VVREVRACKLEAMEASEVRACKLKAVEVSEVSEMPEVIRCALLCMLEAVEGSLWWCSGGAGGVGDAGGDTLRDALCVCTSHIAFKQRQCCACVVARGSASRYWIPAKKSGMPEPAAI